MGVFPAFQGAARHHRPAPSACLPPAGGKRVGGNDARKPAKAGKRRCPPGAHAGAPRRAAAPAGAGRIEMDAYRVEQSRGGARGGWPAPAPAQSPAPLARRRPRGLAGDIVIISQAASRAAAPAGAGPHLTRSRLVYWARGGARGGWPSRHRRNDWPTVARRRPRGLARRPRHHRPAERRAAAPAGAGRPRGQCGPCALAARRRPRGLAEKNPSQGRDCDARRRLRGLAWHDPAKSQRANRAAAPAGAGPQPPFQSARSSSRGGASGGWLAGEGPGQHRREVVEDAARLARGRGAGAGPRRGQWRCRASGPARECALRARRRARLVPLRLR